MSDEETPVQPVKQNSAGPTSGVIIILLLLVAGAIYYWSVYESKKNAPQNLPLIPGDATTTVQDAATTT